jgi:hypothetical protein
MIVANQFGQYGPQFGSAAQMANNTGNITKNMTVPIGAEVTFTLTKRILASSDTLEIGFSTNSFVDPSDAYLFSIKQKEKTIF